MEKMFGAMMKEFCTGMSEQDKQNMASRFEKMAAMCPCMGGKTEEDKKAMLERMKSCCGGKMEMMSAFLGKGEKSGQAGTSGKV
jgi:hypothetical protein